MDVHEEDYEEQMESFDGEKYWGVNDHKAFFDNHFEIKPIGLTMDQIKEFNPPHNPAKITDPRAKNYVAEFGQKSWEVDALKPAIMTEIVESAINEELDHEIKKQITDRESSDQESIRTIIDNI